MKDADRGIEQVKVTCLVPLLEELYFLCQELFVTVVFAVLCSIYQNVSH